MLDTKIAFTATVKEISAKSLVCGDKSYRITLESRDKRVLLLDQAAPYDEIAFAAQMPLKQGIINA